MSRELDIVKEIYKPYKYTIKGKSIILFSTTEDIVIKNSNANIRDLFMYLESRGFYNFPDLINDYRYNINVYKYIKDIEYPKEQRAQDLITTIANLHYKTSYFKDIREDKFKEIYESVLSNINYLDEVYDSYYDKIFKNIYMSPSEQIFMNNYTKLKANLKFSNNLLDEWYSDVKDLNRIRVATLHNNLKLEHFLKSDKNYLISWDDSIIDSPVLDLVKLYKNEYFDLNFESLLDKYENVFKLSKEEKKLLYILLSIPPILKLNDNVDEFRQCEDLRKILDYVYKTEDLIRPKKLEKEIK